MSVCVWVWVPTEIVPDLGMVQAGDRFVCVYVFFFWWANFLLATAVLLLPLASARPVAHANNSNPSIRVR